MASTRSEGFPLIVFDLDGTLLDTLEDLAETVNHICAQRGWPVHAVDSYRYFVGNGAARLMERVIPPGVPVDDALRAALLADFNRHYAVHCMDHTAAYPGVPGVLSALKARGTALAVLSNKPDSAAVPMVERCYPGVFSLIQGALPDVPKKPSPEPLLHLIARLGRCPEETLMVGDSDVDIETAKNAGAHSCGVLWGFRPREELERAGADCLVQVPEELLNIR